jgi:hypothetical protein
MKPRPIVILVEDDENWLNDLSDCIKCHFDVNLEEYSSFSNAETRILVKPVDYDLLVTDICARSDTNERIGLDLADYVYGINNVPVIVVTGYRNLVKIALREHKVVDAFDKGDFDKNCFINAVRKALGL